MAANGAAIDLAQEGVRGAEKRGVSILGLPAEKNKMGVPGGRWFLFLLSFPLGTVRLRPLPHKK